MKDLECVDADGIGGALAHPDDHPVRRHIDACPRCRVLADSYRAFLRAESFPDAGLEHARAPLDDTIARLGRETAPPAHRLRVTRANWLRGLLRPLPAFAAAAVALGIATVVLLRGDGGPEPPALRTEAAAGLAWQVHEAALSRDGTVTLSWDAVPGADSYRIRLYGPELEPLATLGPTPGLSIALGRGALPAGVPANAEVTWLVVALRAGAEIAVSNPRFARVP